MRGGILLLASLVLALAIAAGCSGDDAIAPINNASPSTGTARGAIDGNGAFEIVSNTAGDPANPIRGPFIIRGSNINYDEVKQCLNVDMTVTNAGQTPYSEPVTLTFVSLLPNNVKVKNSINDEEGPGAKVKFDFANDDGEWSPGETSEATTVVFDVPQGVSIGFIARIDVGQSPIGGSIGGIVWKDDNENGMMDPDEMGLGGVVIVLASGASTTAADVARTRSNEDGTYRFDGLEPGSYTVHKVITEGLKPTTPTTINVLLVATDDGVSDFLMANFGCLASGTPGDGIEVGDFVNATGQYDENEDLLFANGLDVRRCDLDPIAASSTDGDWHDDDDDWDRWNCWGPSELRGPVTDVNRADRAIEIMGSWVYFGDLPVDSTAVFTTDGPWLRPGDVHVGDRVRAGVKVIASDHGDVLDGIYLKVWNGRPDKVHGFVQEVIRDNDLVVKIRVLNVGIVHEHNGDDDDDDDDKDPDGD